MQTEVKPDEQVIAYQLPQVPYMSKDLVHGGVMTDWLEDDNLWVPATETVSFKPLILNATHGYYVNMLRVRKAGVLSRHRHSGPVHAFTLRGKWHYLEHDWIAAAGDYVFEPPGETHTLIVPDDVEEMVALFHVTAGYTYVDPYGVAKGYEDVFTKIAYAQRHYQAVGLGADYVKRFMR